MDFNQEQTDIVLALRCKVMVEALATNGHAERDFFGIHLRRLRNELMHKLHRLTTVEVLIRNCGRRPIPVIYNALVLLAAEAGLAIPFEAVAGLLTLHMTHDEDLLLYGLEYVVELTDALYDFNADEHEAEVAGHRVDRPSYGASYNEVKPEFHPLLARWKGMGSLLYTAFNGSQSSACATFEQLGLPVHLDEEAVRSLLPLGVTFYDAIKLRRDGEWPIRSVAEKMEMLQEIFTLWPGWFALAGRLAQRCGQASLASHFANPNLEPLIQAFLPRLCARYGLDYLNHQEQPEEVPDHGLRIRERVQADIADQQERDTEAFEELCADIHPGIAGLKANGLLHRVRETHARYSRYRLLYTFAPMLLGRPRPSDGQRMEGIDRYTHDTLEERFFVTTDAELQAANNFVRRLQRVVDLLAQQPRDGQEGLDPAVLHVIRGQIREFPPANAAMRVMGGFPRVPSEAFWNSVSHTMPKVDAISALGECGRCKLYIGLLLPVFRATTHVCHRSDSRLACHRRRGRPLPGHDGRRPPGLHPSQHLAVHRDVTATARLPDHCPLHLPSPGAAALHIGQEASHSGPGHAGLHAIYQGNRGLSPRITFY